jgi:hypothetical protein
MAGPAALSDLDAVREQLCDVLRTVARVTQTRQRHDYGSTTAVETISNVQIPVLAVSIPLETDTLPVRAAVRVLRDGVLFRVECRLREVCGGRVTYEIEVVS